MIFEIAIFAMVAGAYALWGYDVYDSYHQNVVYADCELEKGLLIGKHNFILKAFNQDVLIKNVHITNRICFDHNCKETYQDVRLNDYERYISKMNYTFFKIPKLEPGVYEYKISTDAEGYEKLHSEKLCSFLIRDV